MNIFYESSHLQMTIPLYKVFDAVDGFFPLALKIRKALHEQAYLLDECLKTIFQAIDKNALIEVSEKAHRDYREFRVVCSDIMDDKHELSGSPFYDFMKAYLDEHRDDYSDRYFLMEMAVANTAKHYAKEMIQSDCDKREKEIVKYLDIVELRSMYRTISNSAGYDIDRLNETLKNQFLITPVVDACAHAYLSHYLMQLVTSDSVSSKQLFQAMLEEAENQ